MVADASRGASEALVLPAEQLLALLDLEAAVAAVRAAAIAQAQAPVPAQKVHAPVGAGSAVALLPGLLPDIPAYTVKVNAKFPSEQPPIRGVVCLHDRADGALLALLDSSIVTAVRTGALAAAAADVLARPDARALAVVGAGQQNTMAVRALRALRCVTSVAVYDIEATRARRFAGAAGVLADTQVAASAREACADADYVFVATWPREPVVRLADVRPGAHVSSVGADELGKEELGRDLLRAGRLFVDDRELALRAGAVGSAGLDERAIAGEVAALFSGAWRGRFSANDITVFSSVGLPWQDVAVAWLLYDAALVAGAGVRVALG